MTARDFSLRSAKSNKSDKPSTVVGRANQDRFETHIVKRLSRLIEVRRFVAVWGGLIGLLVAISVLQLRALSDYYQTLRPVSGNTYTEGILGDFTNANPLYATSAVDSAVSKLVFASLLSYDDHNQLVGDLAKDWSVNDTGRVYTVHLKPHLQWQDGQPLTANDVVFTYNTIKNPDAQSPLASSWRDVTVVAPDRMTVTFTLANSLTAFPHSLTNGIVPAHLLNNLAPAELRSATFNTAAPVGAGPFSWQTVQVLGNSPETRQEEIALLPFSNYHGGMPKLARFIVRAFHSQDQLVASFQHNELDAIAGLPNTPTNLANNNRVLRYSLPLTDATFVFFKTSTGLLSDQKVRQALVEAVNANQLLVGLGYPVLPVREPLLSQQLGFDPAYGQLGFNKALAIQTLEADGWLPGKNGVRSKNNQTLSFRLYATDTAENRYLTGNLKRAWQAIGVSAQMILQSDADIQSTVAYHNYDALLYNIALGIDPDVFVYWDSSQTDIRSPTRLNLSEYKSAAADQALEGGRTRADPALRIVKYKPFLATWQQDAPALALYQPRFLYLVREPVYGLSEHVINTPIDRFNNVQNWEIRVAKVTD